MLDVPCLSSEVIPTELCLSKSLEKSIVLARQGCGSPMVCCPHKTKIAHCISPDDRLIQ